MFASRFARCLVALLIVIAPVAFAQEEPEPPSSDLLVTKSGPAQATAGSNVTYTVTLTNLGPEPAVAVTLTDEIPEGMTFVSATETSGPAFNCPTPNPGDTSGAITCTLATFAANASATFEFVFGIPADTEPNTTFTNFATVTSQSIDPNSENDIATATTTTPAPPIADLSVAKSAPFAAAADSDFNFTITLTNSGPSAATNVTLVDTLPGNLTFVGLQQSGTLLSCTTPTVGAGGTITCTSASYAAGATTTLTLTAHVPAGTAGGTTYSNTASATADNDPAEENNVATFTVTVSRAELSVDKVAPATANAGDTIDYVITVTNAGPDPAQSFQLTDVLPAGTTFVSLTAPPLFACSTPPPTTNGTVVCMIETFPAGAQQFTLRVRLGDVTNVTNTASVSSESVDTNTTNDSDSATTAVTPQADLAATKSGPASATPGTNVTYTLGITNNGPSTATNVSFADAYPANTTFVSLTQNSGPTFSCSNAVLCTIPSLAPGASATFTLVLQVSPGATGSIVNTAAASSTTTNDPNPANNNASVTTTLTPSAELALTKTGPTAAVAGTNVTYRITATNSGPSDAANVTISDPIPANTTFVSMTQQSGPSFVCNNTVSCTIASFPTGATATFDLVVQVSPAATGSISNTATIASTTIDPNGNNNSGTVSTALTAAADLVVTKTGPANAIAGDNLTYTIIVANNGPAVSNDVTLTDALPAGTTFVSLAQNNGPTFNCTTPAVGAGGTVTCTIASLAVTTSTFTLVVHVPSTFTGSLSNTATATSNTGDPTPGNAAATAPTAIAPQTTDLAITKTPSATRATLAETITYTIVVTNNGPNDSTSTTVTDVLPAGATFVAATPTQGTCTGTTTVTCNLGTLTPLASATITLAVTLPQTPGAVANTATVTSAQIDSAPANNAATATITVGAAGPSEIPTLSEWMLLLLVAALAFVAVRLR